MVEKFTVAVEVNDSADVVYWIDADVPVAAAAAGVPEPRATLTIVVLASETAATMLQGLLTCLMLRMPSLPDMPTAVTRPLRATIGRTGRYASKALLPSTGTHLRGVQKLNSPGISVDA
jgi:hypothetical protein